MYSKEEISQAEAVDIVDYCNQNGISLKKNSERFYRLNDHDSCVLDRRKNCFHWNSRGASGNVITFIRVYEEVNFKVAMEKLIGGKNDYESSTNVEYVHEPYEYNPNNEVESFDKAREYLTNERKIDPSIVEDLYEKGLIKQDKRNNVLFLWKDYEHIMGCSEQGTVKTSRYKRGSWKSIQKNSTPNYGFNVIYGQPKNLKFFESSIDLLSYATLHKENLQNTHLISMDGLSHEIVKKYITTAIEKLNDAPDSISICVDNDKAGQKFVEVYNHMEIRKKDGNSYDVTIDLPPAESGKDWNDQLKKVAGKREKQLQYQQYRGLER